MMYNFNRSRRACFTMKNEIEKEKKITYVSMNTRPIDQFFFEKFNFKHVTN